MSDDTSQYVLKNLHTNEFEEAILHHSITDIHINHVENHWKPILQNHLSKLLKKHMHGTKEYDKEALFNDAGKYNIQDANWDWRKKYNYYTKMIGYSGCALVCNDITQGLGYFDLSQTYKPQLNSSDSRGLIYIEFISAAPWNRKQIENRKYAGIGESIIHHAIKVSFEDGYGGCIGLHALPQSEGFYKQCGMTNLGIDADKNMSYFELASEQARNFLEKFE